MPDEMPEYLLTIEKGLTERANFSRGADVPQGRRFENGLPRGFDIPQHGDYKIVLAEDADGKEQVLSVTRATKERLSPVLLALLPERSAIYAGIWANGGRSPSPGFSTDGR
jgi:hypothetical protein